MKWAMILAVMVAGVARGEEKKQLPLTTLAECLATVKGMPDASREWTTIQHTDAIKAAQVLVGRQWRGDLAVVDISEIDGKVAGIFYGPTPDTQGRIIVHATFPGEEKAWWANMKRDERAIVIGRITDVSVRRVGEKPFALVLTIER